MSIVHDPERKQFRVEGKPYQGILLYAESSTHLDFYHVYVPSPLRGGGVSTQLIEAAFQYARSKNLRVYATCPFISGDFLTRHPDHKALVDDGFFPIA